MVAGLALFAFLGLVLVAQLTNLPSPGGAPSVSDPTSASSAAAAFERRQAGDPMAIGAVDAPVVLTEWTDLRCPYCAVFSRDVLPALVEEYVDAGLVRIEVRDVAFFGDQSAEAAVAARAAGAQGRYFEYLASVYDAAPEREHPDLTREALIDFAGLAGVPDVERFTADLDDPELMSDALASNASAQQLGVSSVPFFVAGDTALAGAQSLEVFREFLDAAIAKAA